MKQSKLVIGHHVHQSCITLQKNACCNNLLLGSTPGAASFLMKSCQEEHRVLLNRSWWNEDHIFCCLDVIAFNPLVTWEICVSNVLVNKCAGKHTAESIHCLLKLHTAHTLLVEIYSFRRHAAHNLLKCNPHFMMTCSTRTHSSTTFSSHIFKHWAKTLGQKWNFLPVPCVGYLEFPAQIH